MCGIFGSIGVEYQPETIRAVLYSLRHRGPDDWGVWSGEGPGAWKLIRPDFSDAPWSQRSLDRAFAGVAGVGGAVFGHARLSILDLSRRGHQPMVVPGQCVGVLNGEIYNYVELRRELSTLGHSFASTGDTEVLLKGYLTWGADVLRRLSGFFAFAIWDLRTREVMAGRDRLGKKPLYFSLVRGDALLLASEIKALWATHLVEPALNAGVAARYLALGVPPVEDESFFEGIRQVPAASWLSWRAGQSAPQIERYWQPRITVDQRPDDASAELRARLADSVRLRFRSDVPVGLALSGGVDSGGLLATSVAVRDAIGQGRLTSFTATHTDDRWNEERNARRILDRYPQVDARFVGGSQAASYEDFLEFLAHHDEPLASDGIFNQFCFMRRVAETGTKVLLSGQGSDELFLGYPWYIDRYARWLLRRRHIVRAVGWSVEQRRRAGDGWIGAARDVLSGLSNSRLLAYKQRSVTRWVREDAWDAFCVPTCTRQIEQYSDWPGYQSDQIFRESLPALLKDEDRNSMAHGIETRLPYLDYRLVEWAMTLSPELNLREGATKHIVRTAFVDALPAEVVWSKGKRGFYVPCAESWPEHRTDVRAAIDRADCLRPFLDPIRLIDLIDSGQIDDRTRWRCFNLARTFATAEARYAASEPGGAHMQTSEVSCP